MRGFDHELALGTDELEGLRADLQAVMREAMEPAHVLVWLRGGAQ